MTIGPRSSKELAAELRRKAVITRSDTAAAFETVRREEFVQSWYEYAQVGGGEEGFVPTLAAAMKAGDSRAAIYRDEGLAVAIDRVPSSASTMPSLMATMIEAIPLERGMKVLEIGTGTGYNAAIMACIVGESGAVTTMEIQPELATRASATLERLGYSNVRVIPGDGAVGHPTDAPYDAIVVTAGVDDLRPIWIDQLAGGGVVVAPLLLAGWHYIVRLTHSSGMLAGKVIARAAFTPGLEGLTQETPTGGRYVRGPDLQEVHQTATLSDAAASEAAQFFVAVADRRVCFPRGGEGIGLSDGLRGWVSVTPSQAVVCGDPVLLEELRARCEQWHSLGRPDFSQLCVRAIPHKGPARQALPPSDGALVGRVTRPCFRYDVTVEAAGAPRMH